MDDLSAADLSVGERQLWAAVVLQAVEDIDCEAYGSPDYEQAVCFFLDGGNWQQWRRDVAQMIDLHEDDLRRLGRARIAARVLRDPPPPAKPRPVRAMPAPPRPKVRRPLPPRPPAPVKPKPATVKPQPPAPHSRHWRDQPANAWVLKLIEADEIHDSGRVVLGGGYRGVPAPTRLPVRQTID